MELTSGGYDDGYAATTCFWGTEPSSLVRTFLSGVSVNGKTVLDAGCGEGKNANAFAGAGASVVAVDCSKKAIQNGQKLFTSPSISWHIGQIETWPLEPGSFDVIVGYGLLHCLPDAAAQQRLVRRLQSATKPGGYNIICTFNDRSHDLSAHEGFSPLLLPHETYLGYYADWKIIEVSDADLHETHPHNGIPHHHSLTRLLARNNDA